MIHDFRSHRLIVFILIAFVLLGITYSVATPIFEAGDEIWHYPFVAHLATGHSLPIQDPNVKTLWAQEGGQPPLYYALCALATAWIDTSDLPDRLWLNPEAKTGIPLVFGNKNAVVHTSAESFPWHNTTLAVHLIRFLSVLLAACTVLLTYLLALEIKPDDRGLAALACALVAFNPMFLFISASVNNDNLAVPLATLAMLLLTRLITRGVNTRRLVVLGIVLGLAVLSKASDLGLLAVTAVVFAYILLRDWRQGIGRSVDLFLQFCLCAAIGVALGGWWYARNWILYGDPMAFNVFVEIAGGRLTPPTLSTLWGETEGFLISFWGNFGGVNIIAPGWVYAVLDATTILAGIGLIAGLVRRTLPRLLVWPAFWLALICAGVVRWTWLTLASQGRLIFPAISAVALLLVYGLAQYRMPATWLGRRLPAVGPAALAVFLFAFALLAPLTLIAPTYALAPRLPGDAPVPNPVHIVYDEQAELIGYALPQKSVKPGEELPLTLYWRAQKPMTEDFSVYINLSDGDGNILSRWKAFPGQGSYPTRLWQPGEVVVDSYRIPVQAAGHPAGGGRIEVGLFRRVPLETLSARDSAGRPTTPVIARFKIAGAAGTPVENPVKYEFGNQIGLVGYRTGVTDGALRVRLYWQAYKTPTDDYTVFVHLVDAAGNIIAQQDNEPQHGTYSTSLWDAGEIVADDYTLALPKGSLPEGGHIEVGLYRAVDQTRLMLQGGGDKVTLPAGAVGR